jgi:hypothetical protein
MAGSGLLMLLVLYIMHIIILSEDHTGVCEKAAYAA